jgi:hypothetical protein
VQLILAASFVTLVAFKCLGVTITKQLSALTRCVLEQMRVVTVWLYGLASTCACACEADRPRPALTSLLLDPVRWEKFDWLELVGFLILLVGALAYNRLLPFLGPRSHKRDADQHTALLAPMPAARPLRLLNDLQ